MAVFSQENGGLFRYEDFAAYTAKVEETVSADYRGYQVHKNPSAGQGPAELFALNILETYDLKKLGHNSAEYIHAGVEAIKLAIADRERYLGDMDFIRIPYAGLLSKDYARERRKLIDPEKASLELRPGQPEGSADLQRPIDIHIPEKEDKSGDTSYLCVVDKQRNVVSFTPSLHTGFGTNVVMGRLGFSFNCRGDYFSLTPGHANALAPGKRPRSTLQSTLVLKDGTPRDGDGQPRRRRPVHAHPADVPQHRGVRHEPAAGHRGAALVHAQLPAVLLPALHVPRRDVGGGSHRGERARGAAEEGPQAEGGRRRGRWARTRPS